jgi:PIN domain nuclease of toxin-antitoxin system
MKTYFKYFKLNEKEKALEWLEKAKRRAQVQEIFCDNKICYQVRKLQKVY